jgi:hypothetical protein
MNILKRVPYLSSAALSWRLSSSKEQRVLRERAIGGRGDGHCEYECQRTHRGSLRLGGSPPDRHTRDLVLRFCFLNT